MDEAGAAGVLAGRVALVTGASRGIGAGIATAYAAAGADVALLARDAERLDEVATDVRSYGRRALVLPADVLDPDALRAAARRAIDELGTIDVLVNNAGGNSFSTPLTTARFSGWEKVVRLNLFSIVHLCQEVLPHMVERRSGSIINVSSVVALRGAPLMSHYGAAKAAVINLTQSLAVENAWAGVRVNALLPGWIDTDLTDFLRAGGQDQAVLARVPMQRWGTVADIAAPALFLAEDASRFMTGQCLVVDGGLSAMP